MREIHRSPRANDYRPHLRQWFLATLFTWVISSLAHGSTLFVHLGPPSLGGGGTNPVSIPPQAMDIEAVYVTDRAWEITMGLVPGILYGSRFADSSGFYVSAGGGFLFNPDLATLGIYTAFGYSPPCKPWCFNLEYKQSAGIYAGRMVTPYAVRAGAGYGF